MSQQQIGIARAHANIALIKYWGKRNDELFLPLTSSLSLTLDAFYTDTKITFSENFTESYFFLDGQKMPPQEVQKLQRFVNLFEPLVGQLPHFQVESYNHVPTAAGLASSSSAFSALACAILDALNLDLDSQTLSTYARQGSGSATRSLFGGFVEWEKGQDDDGPSSFARPIDDACHWDIAMLVVVVNEQEKHLSSREGMAHTRDTSPFYHLWPEEVAKDLAIIKEAIAEKDFQKLGEVAEHNAMKMHATMLSANPSFTYFEPATMNAMNAVRQLRDEGFLAYITMDAGPNVKIICKNSQVETIHERLLQEYSPEQLIIARPGPAPRKLSAEEFHDQ